MKLVILFLAAVGTQVALSQTPTPTPTPKPDEALIQAVKAQNAKATQINGLITAYYAAVAKKDWTAAADSVKQLIALDPKPNYYLALANSELNSAKNDDAIAAYKTFFGMVGYPADLKIADAATKALIGIALTNTGNAYLKLKNYPEAIKNYESAAEIDPHPATAYFNLCATEYNIGQMDAAILSCDKAIRADPTKADAYFIKGSALYGNGNLDANNKYVLPPGTIEALKKYLELAPTGPHVEDVKAMLDAAK